MSITTPIPAVLTLEEAADYLRLPPELVVRQATQGHIPGRQIEDRWRFLKTALDAWLQAQDQRLLMLNQAGALADDDQLAELRAQIYRARQRSEEERAE